MSFRPVILVAATLAWLSASPHPFSTSAGQRPTSLPISIHPENPHYFLWRGKPVVLIGSGEHYGALLKLDFDYLKYFDTLAAD